MDFTGVIMFILNHLRLFLRNILCRYLKSQLYHDFIHTKKEIKKETVPTYAKNVLKHL